MLKDRIDEALRESLGAVGYCKRDVMASIVEVEVMREKENNKPKNQERKNDSEKRMKIQESIKKMHKQGFPKEEALKRIQRDFSDSEYSRFFASWVENWYKKPIVNKTEKDEQEDDISL